MNKPWLTVAMTTYNAEEYLAKALDSIIAQNHHNIEIIVVDDASSDKTLAILSSYSSSLNIKSVVRDRNTANWMAGLNEGLKQAQGEYVSFLQHDDYWLDGRLDAAQKALEYNPNAVLLLHASEFVDSFGVCLGQWNCPLPKGQSLEPDDVVERLLVQNFVATPAPIFRKDVAIRVGGLDEKLWYSADWDFWLKLATEGSTIYLGEAFAAYRIHNQSMTWWRTADQIVEQRRQMQYVLDFHYSALESRRSLDHGVRLAAMFSVEVNSVLAAHAHKPSIKVFGLMVKLFRLGPSACFRYLRDSRIIERIAARVRTGMHHWHKS